MSNATEHDAEQEALNRQYMETHAKCGDCGTEWHIDKLDNIEKVFERVAPGEIMPAGQCPECGALCHLLSD